jgi:two-component system response regulator
MNPASSSEARILVLEPDEHLSSAILSALREVSSNAIVDLARSLEEAQRMAMGTKPDLFVLDVDATYDLGQEFLYDLRTSHPNARAIILTAVHLAAARERAAGLGAIHFLEKPFPHSDFVDLVQALLRPASGEESEKFQGTLSELHIADIIQLKCMSGQTTAIEFTASTGDKARVFFENGQVRHATAAGKEGMAAFNEIMAWKGGTISEIAADAPPRTIDLDWQVLLMEGIRQVDEAGAARSNVAAEARTSRKRKILVIDDSPMLLNFVKEMLSDANYEVKTAATAAEGLKAARSEAPDLILLDYILPDMKGDEALRKLQADRKTTKVPVIYMSGLGADLQPERSVNPNVIGFLNKPFTSDLLIKTVESHMSKSPEEPPSDANASASEPAAATEPEMMEPASTETEPATEPLPEATTQPPAAEDEWWSAPQGQTDWPQAPTPGTGEVASAWEESAAVEEEDEASLPTESVTGGAFFCGDTRFFSLNWALQTIRKAKLTGTLRSFWSKEPVELLARNGQVVLVTTRDPELYCAEAPITLADVDPEKISAARAQQRETGGPMFLTLAEQDLILREPAVQLVQHYGQKLFAQLWTGKRVRFVFELSPELPPYAHDIPSEADIDNWTLTTLRSIQFQDLGNQSDYDVASIPAYTKDGFERVQNLRLTVAEAQFASQFNGVRSIQQIAKNLRLDLKFARVTLFRFIALEIVECWPPTATTKTESKGIFSRLTRTIGIGE